MSVNIIEHRKPFGSVVKGTHAEAVYSDGSGSFGFWSGVVPTREVIDRLWSDGYNTAPANLSLVSVTIKEF